MSTSGGVERSPPENLSGSGNQPQEEHDEPAGGNDSEDEFYGCEDHETVPAPAQRLEKRSTRGVLPRRLKDYVVDLGMAVEGGSALNEKTV